MKVDTPFLCVYIYIFIFFSINSKRNVRSYRVPLDKRENLDLLDLSDQE